MRFWSYLYFSIDFFIIANCNEILRHYIGRYRHFDGEIERIENVSAKSCIEKCQGFFTFAALKNGECYCGNNFNYLIPDNDSKDPLDNLLHVTLVAQYDFIVYSVCLIGYYGSHCDQPCLKCQNSVPCMRENGGCFLSKCLKESDEKCDMARFFNDLNVAFNRPAYQSSDYHNFVASLAVDGNNISNFDVGKTCSHTKNDLPWFYVDLEFERRINKVIITNRMPTHGRRLQGAHIYLTNQPPSHEALEQILCGNITNDQSNLEWIDIKCESSSKNRYLVVRMPRNEFLTICEIEAYEEGCIRNEDCGINERCLKIISEGKYYNRCTCEIGNSKDTIYSPCTDIDECIDENHHCNPTISTCLNNDGDYSCECKDGYEHRGNNKICHDIDECESSRHTCNTTVSTCVNINGSYSCECKDGYEYKGSSSDCLDIDECLTDTHLCNIDTSICINNDGGHVCECKLGYIYDGSQCYEEKPQDDSIEIITLPVASSGRKLFAGFYGIIFAVIGMFSLSIQLNID